MFLRPVYHLLAYYLTLLFFGMFGAEICLVALLAGVLPATECLERGFQRLIHRHFALFHWWCRFSRLIFVHYHGFERLPRGGLMLVANHPSLIDIVLLMAFVKQADCIVKSGLRRNPFTRATIRAAGYVRNDSGPGVLEDCVAALQSGSNLIVFPEGTRTPADGTIALKRGAANIAVRAMRNVTPVFIRCAPRTVGKGKEFLQALSRTIYFTIEVKEDIDIRPFIARAGSDVLAARRLTDHLQDYFSEEKSSHAA